MKWRLPIIFSIQVAAFTGVFLLAYDIRFDGAIPPLEWAAALAALPLLIPVKLAAFVAVRSHKGWWRYATFADMVNLGQAATLGTIGMVLIGYLYQPGHTIPRSVLLMDWAGTLLVLGGLRGSTRLVREHCYPMVRSRPLRPVLVVGTSEASLALVREVRSQLRLGLRVVGLLDADRSLQGRAVAGIPVLGDFEDLPRVAARRGVTLVLVPTPAVPPTAVRALVAACETAGVEIQVVPGFDALLSGRLVVQPRGVDIEDLLAREPVRLDSQSIGRFLTGRPVLITGAAGSIGSELCRQVLAFHPSRLILLDHSENGLFFLERELRPLADRTQLVACIASITDVPRLRALFNRQRPAVVFHAAAHKHVPMMEANPGEAVKNNVFGTQKLVDEAIRSGVEAFVMISTDKAVHPTSVMGACKRLAEMYVQALTCDCATRLVTVRFGNVLGSNGSVVPLFKEQIRRGGPVTVTHPEMTRYFMTIPEASQLVLQAGALGRGGEIFVLDMGEPIRILDLAHDLIRLSGLSRDDMEIQFTGLRPGEKLYEELYDDHEERTRTPHPKIFAARHRPTDLESLCVRLTHLANLIDRPAAEVIAALRAIVPEYRPDRPTIPAAPVTTGSPVEIEARPKSWHAIPCPTA